MIAISLWQPWASLMSDGRKRIETRHWRGPLDLVGQEIAIHAAKKVDAEACRQFGYDPKTIVRGAIVSTHKLLGYIQFTEQNRNAIMDRYGNFEVGRWGWVLPIARKLYDPIPAIGHQGVWYWCPPWED